ncbi:MAG: hypothetical protein AB1427_02980 [Thermodesulfobacteriota bacterium]
MSITALDYASPFFSVSYVEGEEKYAVRAKSIVLNMSDAALYINGRPLAFFRSTVAVNTVITHIARALIIGKFDAYPDVEALFEQVKNTWVLAYDATREERHKGVALWRSPKIKLGNIAVNMCFAGSVPLNVGLHREHWGGPPIKEVHVQIVGVGRMQQYYENDLKTLYREDPMAPGAAHPPMYDENINYPWHQYETTTKAIFMAVELTPEL